jgi:hypothetical protein
MRAPQFHIHAFRKHPNKSMLLHTGIAREETGSARRPFQATTAAAVNSHANPPLRSQSSEPLSGGEYAIHSFSTRNSYTDFIPRIPARDSSLHTTTRANNNQPRPLVLYYKVAHLLLLLPRYSHIHHHEDTSRFQDTLAELSIQGIQAALALSG